MSVKLVTFKSVWEMQGQLEQKLEKIANAGYEGVEIPTFMIEDEKEFVQLLEKYRLRWIAQVITTKDYILEFKEGLAKAKELGATMVNSHSAADHMSWDEQREFFDLALSEEQKIGLSVGHETHRGRPTFTPWTTGKLLKEFPELKIVADFSHWCCVCESMLENHKEDLELAMSRAILIHGRIGYEEGPQVADPRAPEYKKHVETFLQWWVKIAKMRKKNGETSILFTPEFGPPRYQQTVPFTDVPVTDLWEVNYWMKKRMEQEMIGV